MKLLIMLREYIPFFKLDLKMKLTIYIFLISLFQIHANSYSQNTKITLDLDNVTIEDVLQTIEVKSEFKFLYNDKEVDYKKLVSVKYKKAKILKILKDLFNNTNINFEVLDRQIILVSDSETQKDEILNNYYAAQNIIKGAVKDETGVPIPGANVIVKGTNKGVVTDFDGGFSIEASSTDVLQISFIGYEKQEVTVGNQTTINIVLIEDAALLDQVVVIGYGKAKRTDLTESVTQVTAKSFENQPVTRVEEALQGRTAGVTVARSNGTPGGAAKIRVRGVNSITGNNSPLVVIDGVIGGDLRTLNPNDIESFNVLKDASATAIYGSRGANGVILVTTKKGKGKTKMMFESFLTFSQLAKSYDNRVDALEHFRRTDNAALFPDTSEQDLIDNPVADRESELFRDTFSRNYQLSVSGGDDKFNYFVSGNYADLEGIMIKNDYERYSLRANIESQVNDKLKIGLRTFFNREIDNNNPNALNRVFGGPVVRTLTFDPTFRLFNPDGSFNLTKPQTGNTDNTYFVTNLLRSDVERKANRFNANINVEYEFLPSFTYTLIAGATTTNQTNASIRIENGPGFDYQSNQGSINSNEFLNYQISNLLNWNKTFNEKHNFDVLGVYEFTKSENTTERILRRSLPPSVRNITDIGRFDLPFQEGYEIPSGSNGVDGIPERDRRFLDVGSGFGESAIESFLGRVKYTFDESLSVSASIRRDETTAFFPDERVGVFKSFSLGYNFNKLAFVQNSNTISDLRLRASWGETGNQNAPRSAFEDAFTINVIPLSTGGTVEIPKRTTVGNPDLTWEITEQANIGLDLGLFNSRVNLTVDLYQKKTKDLLVTTRFNQNVPGTFITENAGDVENKGIDVAINADIIRSEDFRWNTLVAFSYLQNEVVQISSRLDRQDLILGTFQDIGLRNIINVIKEGEPLGSFYGTVFSGEVDDQGNAIFDPVQVIGNGLPTTTWGFNNTLNYKNWNLNFFIQGSHGFEVFNQVSAALAGGEPNFRAFLKADDEDFVANSGLNSSRYVEKGDFIRLSNLTLGYNFDSPVKGIDYIKVYGSGQNLFLITDYSGYDPEISSSQSTQGAPNPDVSAGIDSGAIPNPRTYTFGVKVGF